MVLKSGSFNLQEPSGPVQDCNGIALPFYHMYRMMRWFERNRRKCAGEQSVDGVDLGDLFL